MFSLGSSLFATQVSSRRLKTESGFGAVARAAVVRSSPSFYQDYGRENDRFAVRPGVKGECAGSYRRGVSRIFFKAVVNDIPTSLLCDCIYRKKLRTPLIGQPKRTFLVRAKFSNSSCDKIFVFERNSVLVRYSAILLFPQLSWL